jgi:predicted amidohydrolase YtcJ
MADQVAAGRQENGEVTRILLRGGYVHTPADPHATALAIQDGEVVWTGDDDASEHFADGAGRVVELEGRLETPAFVDAHVHLAQAGLAASSVDLTGAASAAQALDRLAAHAATSTATVVRGHGWDESAWPEGGPFTGEELARAVGGRAAYVTRVDMHSAVVTGIAGRRGRVERDEHHEVRAALFRLISAGDRAEAIREALGQAAATGIGMVHELGAPHICPPSDLDVLAELDEEGGYPETVRYWGDLDVDLAAALGCAGAAGDLCADGAVGSRTAALHTPYADDESTSGHLYLTADQVADHVVTCTRAGLQAGFHVIGERAVAETVAGFAQAAERLGEPAVVRGRHRLEHLEMVTPGQLATLGRLGVTASVQPAFDRLWGWPGGLYERRLADRSASMNPFASMNRAGMPLAFGSDVPVTPFDPWGAVRAAAFHHREEERTTVRAAFNAHTRGGWRAARMDDGGVIALGAPASIAVWDVEGALRVQTPNQRIAAWSTDPRAGVPQLPDLAPGTALPRCAATLVRGRVVHDPGRLVS